MGTQQDQRKYPCFTLVRQGGDRLGRDGYRRGRSSSDAVVFPSSQERTGPDPKLLQEHISRMLLGYRRANEGGGTSISSNHRTARRVDRLGMRVCRWSGVRG